jgi:hypothetical protein
VNTEVSLRLDIEGNKPVIMKSDIGMDLPAKSIRGV